jgi:hypothetical protein
MCKQWREVLELLLKEKGLREANGKNGKNSLLDAIADVCFL